MMGLNLLQSELTLIMMELYPSDGQDMGPLVEQFWGDDDYEYFLSIPKKSIEMFLLHLMKLAFNTEKKITFGDCKEILEVNKIEHAFNWWA